jgi:hypothetical protein
MEHYFTVDRVTSYMSTVEHDTFGMSHLTVVPENFEPESDDGSADG